jgi:hypothetical protein
MEDKMNNAFFSHIWMSLKNRQCRNDRTSLIKRFFCWLIPCCPDESSHKD